MCQKRFFLPLRKKYVSKCGSKLNILLFGINFFKSLTIILRDALFGDTYIASSAIISFALT
jgi:hypothetical protein